MVPRGLTGFISGANPANGFAGIVNTFVYNNRLQLCRTAASSTGAVPTSCTNSFGNVLDLNYDYHPPNTGDNGDVYAITNYRDTTRSQTFAYDSLNRLTSAQTNGTDCTKKTLNPNQTEYWGNSYTYDAWGNLLAKTVTKCSAEPLNESADTQNRMHVICGPDYSYDAAGNMTYDATGNHHYTYDGQSQITQVDSGSTATHTYDAEGHRLRKDSGSSPSTEYVYFGDDIVAEKNVSTGAWTNYVFFDGRRVARQEFSSNAVAYYFSDHLKTADVITDAAGNIKSESDYYPWGGELPFTANDPNHYKFTGKERDNETGLDLMGYRYYSSGLGRFVSTDPKMMSKQRMLDPQQWNMYQYSRDNPTTYFDPDGMETRLAEGMSAKDQSYVVNNLARMYHTSAGKGFLDRAAKSKFMVTIGTGHLGRTKLGPPPPAGAWVIGGSEKVEGGNTRYGVTKYDGHTILVAQSPDTPNTATSPTPPIQVIIDKDQSAEINKDPATVFAHELGGHTADVLNAAESNVNQFIDGVDPKSEKSSEAAEKAATPLPKAATQDDINAVKNLLHVDDKKKEEPK